jgi:hypothetical protein
MQEHVDSDEKDQHTEEKCVEYSTKTPNKRRVIEDDTGDGRRKKSKKTGTGLWITDDNGVASELDRIDFRAFVDKKVRKWEQREISKQLYDGRTLELKSWVTGTR